MPIDFVTPTVDWGTALTPGVSTARDVYEIGTGRDLVTDEEIGLLGRGLALAGFFTPASGKSLRYGGEQIVNGARRFWNWMRRGANNAPAAINSLADVSTIMRANIPQGKTIQEFGHDIMQWGSGSAAARERMETLTVEELRNAGITAEMAESWATAYEAVTRLTPNNPSAAGRAELMRRAAELLQGQ